MGAGHKHHHSLEFDLKKSVSVIFLIFIVELVGGFLSNSLALLSDAVHMITDVVALALVLGALLIAKLHPSLKRTFGYHRVEILVSIFNGILLIFIAVKLFTVALSRFQQESVILTTPMITATIIGLLANLYVLNILKQRKDITTKSAVLHVLSDTIFSFIVLITGIIIAFTGVQRLDSIVTIIFVPFIGYGALRLLYESFEILIEGTPKDINIHKIVNKIKKQKGVTGVHRLHVWGLCPHINILTVHIQTNVKTLKKVDKISKRIKAMLKKENILYSTLQFEYSRRRYSLVKRYKH